MTRPAPRRAASAAAIVAAIATGAAGAVVARSSGEPAAYTAHVLVSDGGVRAPHRDPGLVNAWGLAASPTGPWWVGNEARDTSTLYAGDGRKQLLTVSVPGGPTGVAYHGGRGFLVRAAGRSAPARFVYACEDGRIRAWTPTVPGGWSARAEIAVDASARGAVFRGVAIARGRLYATDVHADRVDVFDSRWRPVRVPGGFRDPQVPDWYAPDGIAVAGGRVFVTYVWRAPVDGNDAPSGGYVDEFDLDGRLVSRVARMGPLAEPWGLALAPRSFGRFGGDLLVASFGDGRIDAYRRAGAGWRYDGVLRDRDGRPLVVGGIWGIAFGNGADAGPRDTLYAAAGPHRWHGASELAVHGALVAIRPA
ncbi:MAG TPA: TIGR03118 family protein [Gaiellaceae bacterium]|nr:TIGR03118 family protein [Gaiellaceae bacterium]